MVNIWVNIMNMLKIRCLKIPAKFLLNTQISCQELSYAAQVCTFDAKLWKLVPSEREEFVARFPPVWKCIKSTNPCCSPVQPLRFMHFRNLHHCLFKCRNYWIDRLYTFRTFLSCPALSKYFDLKSQRFLHFRNLHHRFSHPQSLTEISITFLPERFVNLHHKSPCCFSPNV